MALIGLRYIVTAPLKEKTTYGTGFVLGKAIKADLNVTTANAELHADDVLAESDNSFVSGTLSVGVDDIAEEHKNIILGHEENDGETTANVDDAAIEVGLGFYGVKMKTERENTELFGSEKENLQNRQKALRRKKEVQHSQHQSLHTPLERMMMATGKMKKHSTLRKKL